jgi:hypothetical protein
MQFSASVSAALVNRSLHTSVKLPTCYLDDGLKLFQNNRMTCIFRYVAGNSFQAIDALTLHFVIKKTGLFVKDIDLFMGLKYSQDHYRSQDC